MPGPTVAIRTVDRNPQPVPMNENDTIALGIMTFLLPITLIVIVLKRQKSQRLRQHNILHLERSWQLRSF